MTSKDVDAIKASVDRLIDAYEDGQHRTGGACINVQCFKEDLTFAMEGPDGQMHYRGRILVPVARKKKKPGGAARQTDIEDARIYR
jgi:hypothetical protein